MISIKQKLFEQCSQFITNRIGAIQKAIQIAQTSANEETKSSAGDKYETGRAMMQLEIEKNTIQLTEALKVKQALDQIISTKVHTSAAPGSLVITSTATYYIAISAGKLTVDTNEYFAISPGSPIGKLLMGLSVNTSFTFNKKTITVKEIY